MEKEVIYTEKNIKIIFSDVDSTLLMPHQEKIDRRIFELVKALNQAGIKFCVASGRSYEELKNLFSEVQSLIYFMPLDGGLVIYKDEVIIKNPFKREYICRSLNMMPDSNLLLYGKDKTYFRWVDNNYNRYILNPIRKNVQSISRLDDINEEIYKASYFNEHSYSFERFKSYVKNNRIFDNLYEDEFWCDFVLKGISKGSSAKKLMQMLNINRDDAMAFGDNTNDLELLRVVKESYAMAHGKPEIKAVARYTCENVAEEIERMISNG